MQQAYRLALIGLLALTQLFAPLVHAHAGGGDFPGIVHLPGLEFLAKADGGSAQSSTHKACLDVIVSVAPGLKAAPAPNPGLGLPPYFRLWPAEPKRPPLIGLAAPPSPTAFLWLTPSPRAPPRLG